MPRGALDPTGMNRLDPRDLLTARLLARRYPGVAAAALYALHEASEHDHDRVRDPGSIDACDDAGFDDAGGFDGSGGGC